MIKRYDYLTFILDIDEAKTQTEIQIDKIDKIQVVIEMMHTQTIMQILVSFFLVNYFYCAWTLILYNYFYWTWTMISYNYFYCAWKIVSYNY
jgi:hypothetical protein